MTRKALLVYFVRLMSVTAVCASLLCPAAAADAAIRAGVLQFESGAVSASQADLITDLLAGEIAVYEAFSADFGAGFPESAGVEEAVSVGAGAGWDYVMLWSLKDVSEIGPMGLPEVTGGRLSGMASATLDVRVIDVRAAEILAGISETGSASGAVSPLAVPRREAMETEFGELKARAVVSAVSLAGRAVRGLAGHKDLLVTGVKGEEYTVNVGTENGAQAGWLYVTFSDWPWDKIPVALLRLRDVGRVSSICVPVRSSGAAVLPGDRLEAVSSGAAKELALSADRAPQAEKAPPDDDAVSADVASGDAPDLIEDLAEMAESRGALIVTGEISSGDERPPYEGEPAASPDLRALWENSRTPGASGVSVESPDAAASAVTRAGAVDRDNSTGTDVIETYQMSPIDRSNIRIGHTNARNLYERGRYAESFAIFKGLADSYRGNYLSAYWAGMASLRLGRKKEALAWFDRALAVNPDYRPALEARGAQGQ
ncbi:MAG: tetratricopeptide repeat protein [Synergistaceae bacterium]|jgi:hypothetical protein|nr:tetratricopeptide repeat protein [Synergistaceae bacterium]